MRFARACAAVLLSLVLLSACEDASPTEPVAPTLDPALTPLASKGKQTKTEFGCTLIRFTPAGPHSTWRPISFPDGAMAADGSTVSMVYRFHIRSAMTKVDRVADCYAPNTPAAQELLQQRLKQFIREDLPEGGEDGIVMMSQSSTQCTIYACSVGGYSGVGNSVTFWPVGNNPCYLNPYGALCVAWTCSTSAYDSRCYDNPCGVNGYTSYEWLSGMCDGYDVLCPNYGCVDEPTGGGSPTLDEYDTPIGEPIADDEDAACHWSDNAARCNMARAQAAQKTRVKDLTNGFRSDPICQELRTTVFGIVDAEPTRLWIWTNRVTAGGKTLLGDVGLEEVAGSLPKFGIHLWDDPNEADGMNMETVAHEALHVIGGAHGYDDRRRKIPGMEFRDTGMMMEDIAKHCAYR